MTAVMRHGEEFARFYRATYPRIVAVVYPIVANRVEAEDVTQEAFVRAAHAWETISLYELPESWVRKVAVNLAISTVQRARRRAAILTRHRRITEVAPAPSIERMALVTGLRSLPLSYRTVLVLHYLLDLSVTQIARELDAPEATVRTRLARGRARLAPLLAITDSEPLSHASSLTALSGPAPTAGPLTPPTPSPAPVPSRAGTHG